jgi:hypothetical protein
MAKYDLNILRANDENLKHTWKSHPNVHGAVTPGGDKEYMKLFREHYDGFTGSILEIGAGTGFLANEILTHYPHIDYTILDIEKNIEEVVKKTLIDHPEVKYITSANYEKVFDEQYDMLLETHCLSETPRYYYTNLFNNLSIKSCFVIDYGGDPTDPGFNDSLLAWFEQFPSKQVLKNYNLAGGKLKGIPVYIGKPDDSSG